MITDARRRHVLPRHQSGQTARRLERGRQRMPRVRRLDRAQPIRAQLIPRDRPRRARHGPRRIRNERREGEPVDETELLQVGVGDEQERVEIGRGQMVVRPGREARVQALDVLLE